MGFRLEPNVYKLTFEDPDLAGFECKMRELSVAELLEVTELLSARGDDVRTRTIARNEMIASNIIEWNLEDVAGGPVPVSADALMAAPRRLSVAITAAWLREVVGLTAPPAPPSDSSDDGSSSLLASLPMETPDE